MTADDERIAKALRELRRRSGLTQEEAAAAAGLSRRTYGRAEVGKSGSLPLDTLRSLVMPFGARLRVSVWWNGADLDRLLDERHAAVVDGLVGLLGIRHWLTAPEVSFSEWGERGSIDVLGFHRREKAAVVAEVKSAWGSFEETHRRLDVKVRLAPKLVEERFGERPLTVSRLLVLPDEDTLRRIAARHAATLDALYPARAREIRAWLRRPTRQLNGLWFVANGHASAKRTSD